MEAKDTPAVENTDTIKTESGITVIPKLNRAQRRQANRRFRTHYKRQDFDLFVAVERLKHGITDLSDLDIPAEMMHLDNQDLAPDGTKVMLNADAILSRNGKWNPRFLDWVRFYRNKVFTITREDTERSLVALTEDDPLHDESFLGEDEKPRQRWLFDLYTDLLVRDDDFEFKPLAQIEERKAQEEKLTRQERKDIKTALEMETNYVPAEAQDEAKESDEANEKVNEERK